MTHHTNQLGHEFEKLAIEDTIGEDLTLTSVLVALGCGDCLKKVLGEAPASTNTIPVTTNVMKTPVPSKKSRGATPKMRTGHFQSLTKTKEPTVVSHVEDKGLTVYRIQCQYTGIKFTVEKREVRVTMEQLSNQTVSKKSARQVKILSEIKNNFIVKFEDGWLEQEKNEQGTPKVFVYLQLEHCPGGTLEDFISKAIEDDSDSVLVLWKFYEQGIQFLIDVCLGLQVLRDQEVLHRDIKAENVSVGADGKAKIGTFAIARFSSKEEDSADLSPMEFGHEIAGPETKLHGKKKYGSKNDTFAFGHLVAEVICKVVGNTAKTALYDMTGHGGERARVRMRYDWWNQKLSDAPSEEFCETVIGLFESMTKDDPDHRPALETVHKGLTDLQLIVQKSLAEIEAE